MFCIIKGMFCLTKGMFCLIKGMFCLIKGMFCLIKGMFCLIKGMQVELFPGDTQALWTLNLSAMTMATSRWLVSPTHH